MEAFNPFEALADRQTVAPVKAKLSRQTRMADNRARIKKQEDEDAILWSMYRKDKRAKLEAILDGPNGKELRGLVSFLRTMTLSSAPALVRFVENAEWIGRLSHVERDQVWSLVFRAISRLREKGGFTFWDDALPGEELKAFDRIEAILRGPL